MTRPAPTVVFGVGGAGLSVLEKLATRTQTGERGRFAYYAIDTDDAVLSSLPVGVTRRWLPPPSDYVKLDVERYPYLTPELALEAETARRQRPVGRYRVDNRQPPDANRLYQDLYGAVESHVRRVRNDFTAIGTESVRVSLVHSLGGGTGSGAFPLLAVALSRVADRIGDVFNADVSVTGFGVCPRIRPFFRPGSPAPPGETTTYPNTYGALADLRRLLDDEPIEVPVYAFEGAGDSDRETERPRNRPPTTVQRGSVFDTYYLFGADEKRLRGDTTMDRRYRNRLDERVATAVETESLVDRQPSEATPRVGSITHRSVRVPVEAIEGYRASVDADGNSRERTDDPTDAAKSDLKTYLTDPPNRVGETILPIERSRVTALATDDVAASSLAEFLREGLVEWRHFEGALAAGLRYCAAWVDPVVRPDRSTPDVTVQTRREIRVLYADRNERCVERGLQERRTTDVRTSADAGIPNISDPFSVRFVATYYCEPIEAYRSYRTLADAARTGVLDEFSEAGDYRSAFAYPEWYDEDIRAWHDA